MVTRIAKIVSSLKFFATDGSQDPIETVSALSLVEDARILCDSSLFKNDIKLEINIDTLLCCHCRRTQIHQVFVNLLTNAVDAISGLKEKWIRIEAHTRGDFIAFTVTDSGAGISHDLAEKIFQPFFTTKELGKGSGLGLSIIHGILKAHGGDIMLDRGKAHTCFVFTLPKDQTSGLKLSA